MCIKVPVPLIPLIPKINKCSADKVLCDLQDLVTKGILIRTYASGRSTGYELKR